MKGFDFGKEVILFKEKQENFRVVKIARENRIFVREEEPKDSSAFIGENLALHKHVLNIR